MSEAKPRLSYRLFGQSEAMPKKRSYRKIVVIPTQVSLTTTGVANNIVEKGSGFSFGERFYVTSVKGSWSIRGNTVGEGPILVGFCHGDLSTTEVAEALSASPTDPDDTTAMEQASRPVRRVGKFSSLSIDEVLADGREIKTKIKFRYPIGAGHRLDIWMQNRTGAILTGGAVITFDGLIFGYWR